MLADLPTAPWFRRLLVAGLILGIVLLTFTVLQPFIVPLIWGAILAYVSWPLNQRIVRLLRGPGGEPDLPSGHALAPGHERLAQPVLNTVGLRHPESPVGARGPVQTGHLPGVDERVNDGVCHLALRCG